MRLVFGSILVVGGLIGVTVLTRLLARAEREPRLVAGATALRFVAMALVPLGVLMILSSGIRMISAGHVGVALLFGKVQPGVLHEGINLVNPLYDVVEMNTRVLRHQAKYDAASKDLQAVHVEMVLNYRLLPDKAAEVYQRIGPGFASVIIDPAAQEVLKANTALHVATEILHQRPKIKADIQGELTTWLAKYGIEVKEAALANISFDKAYEKAIEAKQIEEQDGVTVSIDENGKLFVDEKAVDWNGFSAEFRRAIEASAPRVFLRVDKNVRYETVLRVIARIKMLGIEDLGLIAEQEEKKK